MYLPNFICWCCYIDWYELKTQMSKNSVNLEERILPTAVGFQAMTVTETKSWESNRIILYEPETNTEGNANITVLFYEITERVESKFWSFKKLKTSAGIWERFNVFMFVLPRYKFRHNVFINAENHGMFSCREHSNGEYGVNMSFCTEVDWVMHGSITKWPLTLSLSAATHLDGIIEK